LIREPLKNAVVIPQRATFEDRDKRYVYVVGKDDVAHQREIVVQNELDDLFVIKKGLDANDRIVLDGVRQVRDGETVGYEFRKPDEVTGRPKESVEK
jgi:membrane fusion protein (multidrug efflux system)